MKDARKSFQVSFEVDYRKTNYIQFLDADGVLFYTQFLWRFWSYSHIPSASGW